jgi:hypothetical protein
MTDPKIIALKVDMPNLVPSLRSGQGRFGWSYIQTANLHPLRERIDTGPGRGRAMARGGSRAHSRYGTRACRHIWRRAIAPRARACDDSDTAEPGWTSRSCHLRPRPRHGEPAGAACVRSRARGSLRRAATAPGQSPREWFVVRGRHRGSRRIRWSRHPPASNRKRACGQCATGPVCRHVETSDAARAMRASRCRADLARSRAWPRG